MVAVNESLGGNLVRLAVGEQRDGFIHMRHFSEPRIVNLLSKSTIDEIAEATTQLADTLRSIVDSEEFRSFEYAGAQVKRLVAILRILEYHCGQRDMIERFNAPRPPNSPDAIR